MVSPGLKSLSVFDCFRPGNGGAAQLLRQTPTLTFPKLEKLECTTLGKRYEIKLIDILLSRCPVLQDLKVTGGLGSRKALEIQIPFQNLRSLCLREFRTWHWSFLVDQFRNSTPPTNFRVENLELDCDIGNGQASMDRSAQLITIVAQMSGTLKTFVYYATKNPPRFWFAALPKVEHLEIRTEGTQTGLWDTVYMNFLPELLPSLKSIKIPLSLRLDECTSLCSIFPTVTTVFLNMDMPSESGFQLHSHESQITHFVDNMFLAFPNIKRVGLDMSSDIHERQSAHIIALITRIIKSAKSANILEFEMESCDYDYLGEALCSMDMEYRTEAEIKLKGFKFDDGRISPEKAKAATLKFLQELGMDSTLYECMNFTVAGPSHSPGVFPSTWTLRGVDEDRGHHHMKSKNQLK